VEGRAQPRATEPSLKSYAIAVVLAVALVRQWAKVLPQKHADRMHSHRRPLPEKRVFFPLWRPNQRHQRRITRRNTPQTVAMVLRAGVGRTEKVQVIERKMQRESKKVGGKLSSVKS
jgi:hypothetical protein